MTAASQTSLFDADRTADDQKAAYSDMQVPQQAVEGAESLDQFKEPKVEVVLWPPSR